MATHDVARRDTAPSAKTDGGLARPGPDHAALSTLSVQLNASAPVQRLANMRPSGTPRDLPGPLRRGIEALSGVSMDGVRVHHNSGAPAQLQALAFAKGRDIHLAPGQERHLPHEAWHVAQQAQGRVRPTVQMQGGVAVNDRPELEREADVMGARALIQPAAQMGALAAPPEDDDLAVVQGRFGVQFDVDEIEFEQPVSSGTSKMTGKRKLKPVKEIRIDRIDIAGRPPGLFVGAEKSHTTNWALYTDQLRNAVLGRDPLLAHHAIHNLYLDARNLPGIARIDELGDVARNRYDTAKQTIDNLLLSDVGSIPEERLIDHLQKMAAAYLAYRNLVPLSQVDIGRATGHGESSDMDYLRKVNDRETGWTKVHKGENIELKESARRQSRESIWNLLDAGAILHLLGSKATPTSAPGVRRGEKRNKRVIDAITQHLLSIKVGYQDAYDESFVGEKGSILSYLESIGVKKAVAKKIASKVVEALDNSPDTETQDNPERVHTKGPSGQGAFSAQLELDKKGKITELHIGGRPITVLGTSQGSHTTAWLVYIDVVRNAVIGKAVKKATTVMDTLCDDLFTLPGAQRVDSLTEPQREVYDIAARYLRAVRKEANSPDKAYEGTPKLQRLIKAYLEMRNALPMSQIKGGLASGKAEAKNRAILRYRESKYAKWTGKGKEPGRKESIYRDAFWALLDRDALISMIDGGITKHDAPGFSLNKKEKKLVGTKREKPKDVVYIAITVKQHLITMKSAYPIVYAELKAGDKESLKQFFRSLKLRDKYWPTFYAYAAPD